MTSWVEMSEAERDRATQWVVDACRLHGASRATAYRVAALFAEDLDDGLRRVDGRAVE